MREDGLDNVRPEKVMVPHWVRGQESLELMPAHQSVPMLGLGNSVRTPAEGITAETVVVRNFDELDALGEKVRAKIVVYNAPFTNYGATVQYRTNGASRAAHYGAAAVLVAPVHVPSVTVTVLPTCAVPESTGRTVAAGGAGLTFAVAAELDATAASGFVAVTTALSVLSTSAAASL